MEHTGRVDLVHVDLFRLGEDGRAGALSAAFEALGIDDDVVGRAGAVTVVEWAELWAAPPSTALRIRLERPKNVSDKRVIKVLEQAPWSAGWP
jgi:tRNA A37 threonylcarbamoyladenosine biosynthesis protein TsaE